jgi:Chaperone of endosialidase
MSIRNKVSALFLCALMASPAAADGIINSTGSSSGSGGITVGAPITGTCPNGQVVYSNSGVIGCEAAGGTGTVTSVSVVTVNGVSGSVANPTTTPAITLTLGAITPSSIVVNGASLTPGTGTYNAGVLGSTYIFGSNEVATFPNYPFSTASNATVALQRNVTTLAAGVPHYGLYVDLENSTNLNNQNFLASRSDVTIPSSDSSTGGQITALDHNLWYSGTGTLLGAYVSQFDFVNSGSGTATTVYGLYFNMTANTANNAIGTLYNIYIEQPFGTGGGLTHTWGNIYGLFINDQNPSGASTNTLTNPPVALHIASQTAAGAVAIEQVGSGINSFAGTVKIGAGSAITSSGAGGALGALAFASVAPAGTLTGATLAAGVTASSLTSVGTLTSLTDSGALTLTGLSAGTQVSCLGLDSGNHTVTAACGGGSSTITANSTATSGFTAQHMLYSDGSLIQDSGTAALLVNATGNGANTFTGTDTFTYNAAFAVQRNVTSINATTYGLVIDVEHQNSTASKTSIAIDAQIFVPSSYSIAMSTATAINSLINYNGTGTLAIANGISGTVESQNTGTITLVRGMLTSIANYTGGTIGTTQSLLIQRPSGPFTAVTSTWTTIRGIEIDDQTPSASGGGVNTVTNPPVALYIASQSGSGAFAIQQNGSGLNTFAGASTFSAALINTGITSDATHTDATICEDTTTHQFYSGSGTLGICLGTSSARYKHDVADLDAGLPEIMALKTKSFYMNEGHGAPQKKMYGFMAEDALSILPALIGIGPDYIPNTFDYLGVVPVLVHAVQQQQAEIEDMKRKVH